jgi:hypothetical protein
VDCVEHRYNGPQSVDLIIVNNSGYVDFLTSRCSEKQTNRY